MDGKVAVTQIPVFAHQPVAVETNQEFGLHLDVMARIGVVGADHRIAEIPGMVGKYVGVDVIAERAQQQDGEHGYGAGVAFVEGVDMPYTGGEEGDPFKQLLSMKFVIMDVTL